MSIDNISPLGEPEKLQIMQLLSEPPLLTMEGTHLHTTQPSRIAVSLFKGNQQMKTEFLSQLLLSPDGLDSDRVASCMGEAIKITRKLSDAAAQNLETALANGTSLEATRKISSILAEHYYSKNNATGVLLLFNNPGADKLSILSELSIYVKLSPANVLCASEVAFLGTEDKNPDVRYAALNLLMRVEPSLGKESASRFLETLHRLEKDKDKLVSFVAEKRLACTTKPEFAFPHIPAFRKSDFPSPEKPKIKGASLSLIRK